MLTVNSTINLAGQAVPNIIPAVQGDTGRVVVFTLADFTIPAGSTATYYVQKPSGEAVYNAATINDNKVTVELTAQSLAETGDNYGQVRILNGEDVVTSFDFILLVKPFRGIDAIESTTEMNIFDEAVQNAMAQFDSMLPDIIAPEFDSSTEYAAGDYVIYGGKLYQFTSAHSGAWTGTDAEECNVTEKLGEGGSGDGLTEDIKQALLQIAEKVVYIDEHGQDYYDALYDAFYPPAEVVSISAVYTQSGTVYDTDTLDSLRADLVVTATYSDQSTETVTAYTLNGTLVEGTSTITVVYGSKTTTFNVTVSSRLILNWDLTQSLTDTKSGRTVSLRGTNGAKPTQNSTGLVFDGETQNADFGSLSPAGKTIEIDVASFQFAGNTGQHIRFVMSPPDNTHSGYGPLLYRANNGWQAYGKNATGTNNVWSGNYSGLGGNTDAVRNIFNGKTVKLVFGSDSNSMEVFLNDESKGTINNIDISAYSGFVIGGGYSGWSSGNGDQCYNMTITGVRVYTNE